MITLTIALLALVCTFLLHLFVILISIGIDETFTESFKSFYRFYFSDELLGFSLFMISILGWIISFAMGYAIYNTFIK